MSIRETIQKTVMSWPGVTERPHRFGGIQFSLGERELGHLHGDSMADLPFTRAVRDELIAAGRARPHHVLPDSGWGTPEHTPEGSVHVALVAEPCLKCNGSVWLASFP